MVFYWYFYSGGRPEHLVTPSAAIGTRLLSSVEDSWDNKKVWCVRWFSLGGCCCSNVIAEGTDRCEGLNLTRCKSHTHTHTHGRRHNMCAHACLDLSLLSGAVGLPPGFSPLSTAGVFLPCKTKLMIAVGWEAVCVHVCVCVCVCVSEQQGL